MILLPEITEGLNLQLRKELERVAERFRAELLSDLSCVNELAGHVERYRGKMLRPTLVLASAAAADPSLRDSNEALIVVATVTEMVHMATLVHDDILDEAELRRRGATLNHLHGNEAAVMLGDYLISHAYHLCSSLEDPSVSRDIASTTNTVCEGELLQLANRNNWSLNERTYFEILHRKTASLCAACCRLGAKLAGADEVSVAALEAYGRKLGVAFQIVDDLLDLTGDTQTVGKTLGRDLEKGKLTLPLILHLQHAEEPEQVWMREALELHKAGGEDRMDQIVERLQASDALDEARSRGQQLVEDARRELVEHLRESPARTLLEAMADAVLSRRR